MSTTVIFARDLEHAYSDPFFTPHVRREALLRLGWSELHGSFELQLVMENFPDVEIARFHGKFGYRECWVRIQDASALRALIGCGGDIVADWWLPLPNYSPPVF